MPAIGSLTECIFAAMARATFKSLDDEGVWANAPTEAECAAELQSVLEDWILLSLSRNHPIPEIDGLQPRLVVTG